MGLFAKTTLTIRHTAGVWRIKRYAYLSRRGNVGNFVIESQQLTFALPAAGPNNDAGATAFLILIPAVLCRSQ